MRFGQTMPIYQGCTSPTGPQSMVGISNEAMSKANGIWLIVEKSTRVTSAMSKRTKTAVRKLTETNMLSSTFLIVFPQKQNLNNSFFQNPTATIQKNYSNKLQIIFNMTSKGLQNPFGRFALLSNSAILFITIGARRSGQRLKTK